jgi:outer membrane protein assembly factor BamB
MNLTIALLLFELALSGQDTVLWQQRVTGWIRAIEVTPSQVFVAGTAEGRFLVAAYDPQRGDLLWEDLPESSGMSDQALVISGGKGRVFAAGYSGFSPEDQRSTFLVRAYEEDGHFLWESQTTTGRFNLANRLAASREHVFAGGVSEREQGGCRERGSTVGEDARQRARRTQITRRATTDDPAATLPRR